MSKHVRTRVSAKPTSLTAPAAAREGSVGITLKPWSLVLRIQLLVAMQHNPGLAAPAASRSASRSTGPTSTRRQCKCYSSGAAVRLAHSPTNSHTTNAAGTLVGPATLNSEHLLNTRRFRSDGGYRRAIALPAHLRDWLMHQPKSLDCDSDGLLTDRGPKPSGNSCLLPNGTGVYWAILSGTAWHSTFGLKSRSLHEPLPVHVTTQTNPKRECRAHVR